MPRPGEVHLWHCDLDSRPSTTEVAELLSADERDRSDRFHQTVDAGRFVAARLFVRRILAAYTGIEPAALRFVSRPGGKPALNPGSPSAGLDFNLAHSGNRATMAIAAGAAVGVDLELIRPLDDLPAIAGEIMTDDELRDFLALAADSRLEAFYGLWTRKEALLKAAATGFGADPRACRVGLAKTQDVSPRVAWRGLAWTLASFAPATGAVGAVALAGRLEILCHCNAFPPISANRLESPPLSPISA